MEGSWPALSSKDPKKQNHVEVAIPRGSTNVAGESFLGVSAENYEGFELEVPLD
jgi:hypothetical protein